MFTQFDVQYLNAQVDGKLWYISFSDSLAIDNKFDGSRLSAARICYNHSGKFKYLDYVY